MVVVVMVVVVMVLVVVVVVVVLLLQRRVLRIQRVRASQARVFRVREWVPVTAASLVQTQVAQTAMMGEPVRFPAASELITPTGVHRV